MTDIVALVIACPAKWVAQNFMRATLGAEHELTLGYLMEEDAIV